MCSKRRYAPHLPLPARAFVPGQGAVHPKKARALGLPSAFDPPQLSAGEAVRYGADLFHNGFFWEAHELFEEAWLCSGKRGGEAEVARGLVKLAAAFVKRRQGQEEGARRHLQGATECFSHALTRLGAGARPFGLALEKVIAHLEEAPNTPAALELTGG